MSNVGSLFPFLSASESTGHYQPDHGDGSFRPKPPPSSVRGSTKGTRPQDGRPDAARDTMGAGPGGRSLSRAMAEARNAEAPAKLRPAVQGLLGLRRSRT